MDLLNAGNDCVEFDEDSVLRLAENAKFYRVCELIYRRQRNYPKVFSCYLKDSSRGTQVSWVLALYFIMTSSELLQVFNFLQSVIESEDLSGTERNAIFDMTIDNIPRLLDIDHVVRLEMQW